MKCEEGHIWVNSIKVDTLTGCEEERSVKSIGQPRSLR